MPLLIRFCKIIGMSLNFIAVFFLVVFTCMISLLVGVISFGNSLGRSAEEFCHHRPVQCTRFVEQSRLLSVIIWPSFQFQWCHSAQQPSLPIEQLLNSLDTFRLLLSLSKWHSSARLLLFWGWGSNRATTYPCFHCGNPIVTLHRCQ